MSKTELLKVHRFTDTTITRIYAHEFEDKGVKYSTMRIEGDFGSEETEYHHYDLYFMRSSDKLPIDEINTLVEPVLRKVNVVEVGNDYKAELEIVTKEKTLCLDFVCSTFGVAREHYRGFDYTNIYGTKEYDELTKKYLYCESEEYFQEESTVALPDGYELYVREYMHRSERAIHAYFNRYELRKDGKCIYEFISTDGHHRPYKDFVCHSNGHRYYPFHISLYGISYIDIETFEVFNYIPRGYDNDYGAPNGESFIVTDVHYDPCTNLIAYGGCYWAGLSDVMVGDFTDPMNFNPRLCSVQDIIDIDSEYCCDIDFEKWDSGGLYIKTDDGGTEMLSVETIKNEISVQSTKKERK
ncbi:MAG: hypothetical protein E7510_13365 [Ruminococcus sp.]|nr:hypothetical protein [Ruminococcus sp.]